MRICGRPATSLVGQPLDGLLLVPARANASVQSICEANVESSPASDEIPAKEQNSDDNRGVATRVAVGSLDWDCHDASSDRADKLRGNSLVVLQDPVVICVLYSATASR